MPSALVATAVAFLALVAGATWQVATVLAVGMLAFQVSIGALNDLVDLERDRRTRPHKPIPAGQISKPSAGLVVVAGGTIGLLVSISFGPAVALVGLVGVGAGYAYDVAPRREIAGPLAFAVALPALLAWTWLAAASMLPPGWPVLLPLAAMAGPAVHLANSMADLATDRRSGATSLATRLGRRRSNVALLTLDIAIWTLAWLSLSWFGPISIAALLTMLVATTLAATGAALSLLPRTAANTVGWMLGAVALALLAVTWGATAGS